eukprot:2854010-Pyramimonas_sp.AAC.1
MFKIVMGGNRDTKHRDDRRGEGGGRDAKHRDDHHRDRRDDRHRDRGAVLREHRAPPPPEVGASSRSRSRSAPEGR